MDSTSLASGRRMTDHPKRPPGRPPLPPEQRRGVTPTRTIRLDAGRWEKLRALGREWLERAIDRAKVPE